MSDESTPSMPPDPPDSPQIPPDRSTADSPPKGDPPPTPFGRQLAQLVVIPAVIVVICVGLSVMFGWMAGGSADIETHLARLRQSGGSGRMAFDLQDPRYKDRSLAAFNIAAMIPSIKDPQKRAKLSSDLLHILKNSVGDHEETLQVYLLMAIGQLGQEGGLQLLINSSEASSSQVRQGAIGGILSWPDRQEAKVAVKTLTKALGDKSPLVVTQAAAGLGELASPQDQSVILALHVVLEHSDSDMRDAVWNAAIALARLGDEKGSTIVATVLLDRKALTQIADLDTGMQDRVMLSTLLVAKDMTDPRIWDKIKQLAAQDSNPRVQAQTRGLLMLRDSGDSADNR